MARSRYAHCPREDDDAGWLFLMQHHGMPTRLLDWSLSPLIATYFAVRRLDAPQRAAKKDGAICALAMRHIDRSDSFEQDPNDQIDAIARRALSPMETWPVHERGAVAVAPPEIHPRMTAQSSMFTLHMRTAALEDDKTVVKHLMKAVVPWTAKPRLSQELAELCIQEHTVFPDLDALSHHLSRRINSSVLG